jgi:hypothetical protein
VRPAVLVGHLDESVTIDKRLTNIRALRITDEGIAGLRISWALRDEAIAGKVNSMEFVRKQDLECIEDWVDPSEPSEIDGHLRNANDETSIYNEHENENTCSSHGL